ncbi:hypothetical protein [Dokdonella sp.]|uniref:hypothetical protein n=1 Tax=Dokdonella sp. TaxID=2291710 RepID=UPI001B2C6D4A|nr:hypothetical protein [Dokdonella sp.]MBO9663749.1 hypothetical protein [Dokdonella sp.]
MPRSLYTLAAALLVAAGASTAVAGTPSGPYAVFQHCPYATNPDAQACVYSKVTSGSFKMGNASVPISAPIILQGGVQNAFFQSPFYEAVGAPTMSPTPLPVPGGLLGLVNPAPDWPFPLWVAFWDIVNSVNGVTAISEPAGPAWANFFNAASPPETGDATVVHLPIRVRLNNPFLGSTCYIGSYANPIVLNLVTNTTNPPPPNLPISGSAGEFTFEITDFPPDGVILHFADVKLVDNSFAVPAAKGCGNIALGLPIITQVLDALVSGAVNLKEGLPAAAGKNTAIMVGNTDIAASIYVQGSEL